MKILLVSDLHYTQQWFEWLLSSAPDHDLLVVAGDLLDQNHPAHHTRQTERVITWLHSLRKPTCICGGNHDREWNLRTNRWEPASWLRQLRCSPLWSNQRIFQFSGLSFLPIDYQEPVPEAEAEIWISHLPPANTPVSTCPAGLDVGNALIARSLQQPHHPKVLLCGHQHTPQSWHTRFHQTCCLNPGMQADAHSPNHILIDTNGGMVRWSARDGGVEECTTLSSLGCELSIQLPPDSLCTTTN